MQLLPFTCGPAALIRLLRDRGVDTPDSLQEQIAIWRTANVVHISDEPAGCSGEGLALAALERGVRLRVYSAHPGLDFADTVRTLHKQELIRIVVDDQREALRRHDLELAKFDLSDANFRRSFDEATNFIVLVRQTYLSNMLDYHWIYARRREETEVLVYDPFLPSYEKMKYQPQMVGDSFVMEFDELLRVSAFNRGQDRCWLF